MDLLSGDRDLRDLAGEEGVDCHGILWLVDCMEEIGIPGIRKLCDGLQLIAKHPRCRLPRKEIGIRLERYRRRIDRS